MEETYNRRTYLLPALQTQEIVNDSLADASRVAPGHAGLSHIHRLEAALTYNQQQCVHLVLRSTCIPQNV